MDSGPVLVVHNQFPKRSETFVFDEFVTWRDHGVDARPVSLLPPQRQDLPAEMAPFADEVICLRSRVPGALARLLLGSSSDRPTTALRRLLAALQTTCGRHDLVCRAAGWATGTALAAVVMQTGARHLHAAWANTPAEACLHASAATAVPYTVSVHAADYWRDTPAPAPRLLAAERVVACNAAVYEDLKRNSPALEGRLHLVPHGARTAIFEKARRSPGPPWRILAIGRHVAKKGLSVLIDACHRLRHSDIDFRCTIVGDDTLHPSLTRRIRAHRLDHAVTLAGPRDHHEIARLMADSHLLAVPSIVAADQDRDGVPNVIVEALLTAMPVVASRCGSIPEVIDPGNTGVLVEPGDPAALARAMVAVINDYSAALALAATGRQRMLDRLSGETQAAFLERLVFGSPGVS